jgi:hypothetical protein
MSKRPYSPEEAQAKREAAMGLLTEGIESLVTSGRWQEYLAMQARFPVFSFRNTMLILMQCPDASLVMKYGKPARGRQPEPGGWAYLGRWPMAGTHAIRILVPSFKKETDEESGEEHQALVGFRLGCVFDVTQTDGAELPEIARELEGQDPDGLYEAMTKVSAGIGFPVELGTPTVPGAHGETSFAQKDGTGANGIIINQDRSPLHQARCAVHEVAHAILHGPESEVELPRGARELEAESVSFIVCQVLGIDTSGYAFDYVANWADGDPETVRELIQALGSRIQKTAKQILTALETV